MAIAELLRRNVRRIIDDWEARIRHLPGLVALERRVLIDHLPELLGGLGAWVEGRDADAERGFAALIEGHALQRLGHGVDLATLVSEYAALRQAVLAPLLAAGVARHHPDELRRLGAGIDRAIGEAVRRYRLREDELRDRVIGVLAHDLRAPLDVILMSATTALDQDLEASRRTLVRVARGAERMRRMIDDVRELARGHLAGGIPARPVACDLDELVRVAVDELRAVHARRTLVVETRGDLRGWFDRDRVLQVLVNLVRNAVEHGGGEVTVRAWERTDRAALLTSVHDHGEPIAPDVLPRLFEPFRGLDAGRRLGLGLYVVGQIVLVHGAVCEVTSTAAEGTTFTITWPRLPNDGAPDPREPPRLPA